MTPHVLVLSTADWDAPLWTNKQHLAVRLADEVEVTYVESLGLRRPALRRTDVVRMGRRLVRGLTGDAGTRSRARDPGPVRVVSPMVVPWHSGPAAVRAFNRARLRSAVAAWLGAPRSSRILWTFSPVTYGLDSEAAATVYHCVDLLEGFPGVDGAGLAEGELALAHERVVALASSQPLVDHLGRRGFSDVRLWENVADVELFTRAARATTRVPGRVVFAGNLSAHKVDVELLERLARRPEIELHLAGPIAEGGGPAPDLTWAATHDVTLHGNLPPDRLAALLASAAVGVIPYLLNDYTAGVYPMKVHEYQAAGLATVATPLPALAAATDLGAEVVLANGEAFVDAVIRNLTPAPEQVAARQASADAHSWQRRTEQALALIHDLLAAPEPT